LLLLKVLSAFYFDTVFKSKKTLTK